MARTTKKDSRGEKPIVKEVVTEVIEDFTPPESVEEAEDIPVSEAYKVTLKQGRGYSGHGDYDEKKVADYIKLKGKASFEKLRDTAPIRQTFFLRKFIRFDRKRRPSAEIKDRRIATELYAEIPKVRAYYLDKKVRPARLKKVKPAKHIRKFDVKGIRHRVVEKE